MLIVGLIIAALVILTGLIIAGIMLAGAWAVTQAFPEDAQATGSAPAPKHPERPYP